MKWQLVVSNKIFDAFRHVDSIAHPDTLNKFEENRDKKKKGFSAVKGRVNTEERNLKNKCVDEKFNSPKEF